MRVKLGSCFLSVLLISTMVGCAGTSSAPPVTVTLDAISVTPSASSIAFGTTQQFKAMGSFSDGSSQDITSSVTWSSSDNTIATISGSGLATPVKHGLVTIKATKSGINGSTGLTITTVLSSIAVSPSAPTVAFGTTQQFAATGNYDDGTSQDISASVTWSSSDKNVATINGAGLVTPVKHGQATITATSGATSGSSGLTVTTALASIALAPSTPKVFVGSTVQFTATGNYDDTTSADITSSVQWSSSDDSEATIDHTGLATGVKGGQPAITATLGLISQSANLNVTALLDSISLSPIGPGIVVHAVRSFTATGNFNDGTAQDLTATAGWTSSDVSLATMAGNVATGQSVGPVTIIATSTSANGSAVSGTTALNIVSSFYTCAGGCMNGDYAFTLLSADSRGPQLFAGSFHADGDGSITGGEIDANTAAGVASDALSGSYVLYADGRGLITFNANAIFSSPITFRFILSSAGAVGKLAQFDGQGTAEGTFEAQTPGAAINAGTYVFRASGIDQGNATPNVPIGAVGIINTDGNGNITDGVVDVNDYGFNTPTATLGASTYAVNLDAHGRGTLTLTLGTATTNYAYYIVDSNRMNFIQTDTAPTATAVIGRAELQTGGPFSPATLANASYAFLLERPVGIGSGTNYDRKEFAQEGQYLFDGIGSITSGERDNTNYQSNPVSGVIGTYNVAATGGRGNLVTQGTDAYRNYVFYLVSPTKAFLLQTTNGNPTNGSLNAPVGEMDQQSGGFNKGTLDGVYALNASALTQNYTEALIWLTFDGLGDIAGIADIAQQGAVSSSVVNATYVTFPDSAGRAGISLTVPAGANNYALYMVSSEKVWVLGTNPSLVGSLNQQ
jgi:uncharacterized protein YjdB